MELIRISDETIKSYSKLLFEQCKPSRFMTIFGEQSRMKREQEILKMFIAMEPEEFIKTVIKLYIDNARLLSENKTHTENLANFEKIKDIMAEYFPD